jgi:hypothetical protein
MGLATVYEGINALLFLPAGGSGRLRQVRRSWPSMS